MDIEDLRALVAVAEEGSMRRAAERLGVAQPPLSRRVARLEQEAGVSLFRRHAKGMDLTAAGERLAAGARRVLEQMEELRVEMRAAAGGARGRVRVAYTSNLGYGFVGRLMARFRGLYPEVRVELREEAFAHQLAGLRSGKIDVGLLTLPIHEPAMVVRRLHREPLRAVLPIGHRLGRQKRVRLADLAGEPFVLCPRYEAKGFHEHLLSLFAGAGFVPRVVQEAEQKHTIEQMIAGGLGVSVLPTSALATPLPGVEYRELTPALPAIENAAVWHETRPPEGPARALVDLAQQLAKAEPRVGGGA